MKRKVIAFGSHDQTDVFLDSGRTLPCMLCDEPIFFSEGGVFSDNLKDVDTPFDDIEIAIGKQCMFNMMEQFVNGIRGSMEIMKKVSTDKES